MNFTCHECEKPIESIEDILADFDFNMCAECLKSYDECVKESIIHPVLALSF